MEEGMKEKQFKSPPPSPLLASGPRHVAKANLNCEILSTAKRFIAYLGLPSSFFHFDQSECFCENCLRLRGESVSNSRRSGDPPKAYALPSGWCFLALQHLRHRGRSPDYQEKWHTAYHALAFDKLRQTLDSGSLEDPGEFLVPSSSAFWCLIGENSDERKKEDAHGEQLKTQVVLSPSIKMIQANPLTTNVDFPDKKTGRRHRVRVAIQVLAKPGSYVTSPASPTPNSPAPSSTATHPLSTAASILVSNVNSSSPSVSPLLLPPSSPHAPHPLENGLSSTELEWRTKERGGLLLRGLMVKVE